MKLFNFPFGPCPQRVTIYLAEKSLAGVEVVWLQPPTSKGDQWPPDFIRDLSPSGALPIVVDGDGTVVRQSLSILEYLEDSRGGREMRGKTPKDRARTREIITVIDEALTYFTLWAQYGSRLAGYGKGELHPAVAIGSERYLKKLRATEQLMEGTQFIAGDCVTTADCVAMANLQTGDIVGQLHRAVRKAGQVAEGTAGEVLVAYSAQAANGVMPELIVRFRTAYPEAQVGLRSLSSDEQVVALEDGRTDLGFLLTSACRAPLEQCVIHRERFVLLAPLGHPLASRSTVSVNELAGEAFVMGSPRRWGTFRSLVENVCLQGGFLPRVVEEADDVPLLMQLVSLGRGITLYSASVTTLLPPNIKAIAIADAHAEFDLSIAWRRHPGPLIKAFVAMARETVRASIPA